MKKINLILLFLIPFSLLAQLKPGIKAPEITLEGIYNRESGEIPTLESLRGKVVILDFWAIWCSPCVASFPKYKEIYKKYQDKGVHFIAITDDPKTKLENFLNKVDVNFWIGRDDDKQDFKNYKVKGRPQTYIINTEGTVVYQGYEVTEELIDEVLKTNTIVHKPKAEQPDVIVNGGFSGGEDPLYNGVNMMLGKDRSFRPTLLHQFIIRPSLQTYMAGRGYKTHPDGHVGVTCSGLTLEDLFVFFRSLSSPIWITNNTDDDIRYDVVYWKKTKGIDGALKEIETTLLESLSIQFETKEVEREVKVMSIKRKTQSVIDRSEIEEGTFKAYTPVSIFISQLEIKSGELYVADESLANKYVYNKGMEWEKMNKSNTSDIEAFLEANGIKIKRKKKRVILYEISNNN